MVQEAKRMRDKFFILILVGLIELIGAGCFVESFGGSVCLGWGSFGCCGGVPSVDAGVVVGVGSVSGNRYGRR